MGMMAGKIFCSSLMELDEITISQIVFRSETVNGSMPPSEDEGAPGDKNAGDPEGSSACNHINEKDDHQRESGQKIAREQSASRHGVEHPLDQQDNNDHAANRRRGNFRSQFPPNESGNASGKGQNDKVHVPQKVPSTQQQCGKDAFGNQCLSQVVFEELRI